MKIFVTGGSGFAGQHLLHRLIAEGHTVLGLARSDRAAGLITAAGGQPVMGDLADFTPGGAPPRWTSALTECDAVLGGRRWTAIGVAAGAATLRGGPPPAVRAFLQERNKTSSTASELVTGSPTKPMTTPWRSRGRPSTLPAGGDDK